MTAGPTVPDVAGTVRAYRVWVLKADGTLRSTGVGHEWRAREMTATCKNHDRMLRQPRPQPPRPLAGPEATFYGKLLAGSRHAGAAQREAVRAHEQYLRDLEAWEHPERHVAPVVGCECGIYACPDPMTAIAKVAASWFKDHCVVGAVDLWGRIHVHGDVYKAEHAAIAELYLPPLNEPLGTHRRQLRELVVEASAAYGIPLAEPPDDVAHWYNPLGGKVTERNGFFTANTRVTFGGVDVTDMVTNISMA